jgi:uncharacterized membrane protein
MNHFFGLRRLHALALLLLGVCALNSLPARASVQLVDVCNKGSIDVAVAWAQETRTLVMFADWESEGWQWIGTGECRRVWLRTFDTMAIVHLVVAGRSPNGTFGVLRVRTNARDIPNGKSELCVSHENFDIGAEVLPPCRAPYVEVPTAASFVVAGTHYEMNATVRPGPSDYASMVAINGPAPVGSSAASAPAPARASNDNTGDFWGSLIAATNEELERRQKAERAPLPAPLPAPPPPPPALSGQAWIDATRAVIRDVDNSCRAAGHHAEYCGCISDALGFGPDNPYVNSLIPKWDNALAKKLVGQGHTWRGRCEWMNEDIPVAQPTTACVPDKDNIFSCVGR